ncbi:TatD family hydrolase [Moraxella sp. ZY210820]|uniref:TatD family hydrolase n=1 Tax=unclassified Moraxella TaxID=2685852 RepID=UPI0027304D52|nr:TatD family hydrolase [Moraxella sp. ZY210820]WLF83166.1 TatD family hydrolase [Moraxella sp. ZY210820]
MMLPLFDTHTHFDVEDFANDRLQLSQQAKVNGVEKLILIGLMQSRFADLLHTHQQMQHWHDVPQSYLAPGLHPIYIEQHQTQHLNDLEQFLIQYDCIAIGEIGLDRFLDEHKTTEMQHRQRMFFQAQIELAQQFDLPILLHIRKAHADVLQILKQHKFQAGGIAHAFSGGVEEAKAFIKMGFKLGITGQITNPNAKKLLQVVKAVGVEHLVIETDCPDMTPLCCQIVGQRTRNTPANLPYVLQGLAQVLNRSVDDIAPQIWQNSLQSLHLDS